MVAQKEPDVKPDEAPRSPPDDPCTLWDRFLYFIDHHPRCGWYIVGLLLLNTLLNLLDLFH